ncbi:ent-copalyl diphosphate synthase 1-like [Impatiens glandulifera]|uniref:ent-copalyl diphosphate synthase 1-like n=1 Tax=Impatiens glandulifera TaxID=253017 RepID=UPI001FB162FD|nr:ent-copalyl diphosphate synthase 1-like [Impatiens glandulifera]
MSSPPFLSDCVASSFTVKSPWKLCPQHKDVFQNGHTLIKLWDHDQILGQEAPDHDEVVGLKKIWQYIQTIRLMLSSMDDGEISVSAYDTAWVALVENIDGNGGGPQFPSSLQWIVDHQLNDGSWGDRLIFELHDRMLNTLACVVAMKHWNIHPNKCEQGMMFIRENINKLAEENAEHMPIGFEVAFPSLIELARNVGIEVSNDSPFLQEIYSRRNLKLKRIPKDIMHQVPTTLLYSLEGMSDLNWEKLLKLQSQDGSFLFSPASTAFALSQTKDSNCLAYLQRIVSKFNGAVPISYPLDLFERIWMTDRLERLGISRYFQAEIKQCLEYVHRYWTKDGICWARNSKVQDIDDTAMGFRVLRLHGHDVSSDVFKSFENDGEFYCFVGQSTQAVTGMLNLYRASQVVFPGEHLLEDAKKFSLKFLTEKQAANQIFDKWIITKDLPAEVKYALDVPWYASLPRLETRFYLEHYGGENDVWIGKTLYRMPLVNNNLYLELANLDYNNCQALHRLEWDIIQKWSIENNLSQYGMSKKGILKAYYLAAASIFEPERSIERLAWAKTTILIETIVGFFDEQGISNDIVRDFIEEFQARTSSQHINDIRTQTEGLVVTLVQTLNQISMDALLDHGRDIQHQLQNYWVTWMMTWKEGGEAGLIVRTINTCAGRSNLMSSPLYTRLFDLSNRLSYSLRANGDSGLVAIMSKIELDMQELLQLVLSSPSSDDIDREIKQTFLTVVKTFYYASYFNNSTINSHIAKVLFDGVI